MPRADPLEYNQYMNTYMKKRWTKRRQEAIIYLGSSCYKCGETLDLQFHHVDPKTKNFSIARASSLSNKRFWIEVEKCILLCKHCHIKTHRI